MPLETAYGREMNIQFTGNRSGGHSCSQHANCMLPKTCDICGIVLCDKTAHFRVYIYIYTHTQTSFFLKVVTFIFMVLLIFEV